MKGKRITAGLLAAAIALAMSGCGEKKKEGFDEASEGDVLKVYMIGSEKPGTKEVIKEVNKITKEKIGATLDWTLISGGGFQEKMNMVYASDGNFDVCFTGYCNTLTSAVENECLLPLDELIDKYGAGLKKAIPEYLWRVATIDGKIYAVPNQQINALVGSIQAFESDLEKYGITDFDQVKSAVDLEKYFAQIKAVDPKKWVYRPNGAMALADKDTKSYESLGNGIAVEKDSKKCKVVNLYKTNKFVSGMKRLHEWFEKGYVRPDIASVMSDDEDYLAKKYVFTHQSWRPASVGDSKFKTWFPGETAAYTIIGKPYITTSNCDSTMLSISRNSKSPVKAMKYINLINTDKKLYNLLSYGIEGKHWEKADEDHIRLIPDADYCPNIPWAYGNQFNAYVLEGNDKDIWEKEREFNLSAETSPLLGFRADTEPITTELAQIAGIIDEYKCLENGSGDWEKLYPEFIDRLDKAGIKTVMDEYQKQIDEFLASK